MDKTTAEQIIQLNARFYAEVASSFSQTRQHAWRGWNKIAHVMNTAFEPSSTIKVLDMGCGNGRFYGFLSQYKFDPIIEYYGVDYNDQLLQEAKQKYPDASFNKLDAFHQLLAIEQRVDAITVFGLTHHVPSSSFRLQWFAQLAERLNNRGILVLTFWMVDPKKLEEKYKKVDVVATGISPEQLEENDYFITWGNDSVSYRYYHYYTNEEINLLISALRNVGMQLHDRFEEDYQPNGHNLYLVFKKQLLV